MEVQSAAEVAAEAAPKRTQLEFNGDDEYVYLAVVPEGGENACVAIIRRTDVKPCVWKWLLLSSDSGERSGSPFEGFNFKMYPEVSQEMADAVMSWFDAFTMSDNYQAPAREVPAISGGRCVACVMLTGVP